MKDWSVVLFFIGLVLMPALIGAASILESPFKRHKAITKAAKKKKTDKVLDLDMNPVRLPIETLIEEAHATMSRASSGRASFQSDVAPSSNPAASTTATSASTRIADVSARKVTDPIPVCLPGDRAPLLQPLLMPDVRSTRHLRNATVVTIREALGASPETVEVLWSHQAEDCVFELVRRQLTAKAQPISRYI